MITSQKKITWLWSTVRILERGRKGKSFSLIGALSQRRDFSVSDFNSLAFDIRETISIMFPEEFPNSELLSLESWNNHPDRKISQVISVVEMTARRLEDRQI